MKGRMKRASGGKNGEEGQGSRDDAEADLKDKPKDYTADNNVSKESEEMKKGGRAKRASGGVAAGAFASGGRTARKFGGKTEIKMHGEKGAEHAGRKPRKSGGRTGSDASPFTSARHGKNPPGHATSGADE